MTSSRITRVIIEYLYLFTIANLVKSYQDVDGNVLVEIQECNLHGEDCDAPHYGHLIGRQTVIAQSSDIPGNIDWNKNEIKIKITPYNKQEHSPEQSFVSNISRYQTTTNNESGVANDVVLLELETSLEIPILVSLPRMDDPPCEHFTQFGEIIEGNKQNTDSSVQRRTVHLLNKFSSPECNDHFPTNNAESKYFCAYYDKGYDISPKDAPGALFCEYSNVIIGFHENTFLSEKGKVHVFLNIASADRITWIRNKMNTNEEPSTFDWRIWVFIAGILFVISVFVILVYKNWNRLLHIFGIGNEQQCNNVKCTATLTSLSVKYTDLQHPIDNRQHEHSE